MTVCIALASELLGAIVTVSDLLLSNDERSAEAGRLKLDFLLPKKWGVMYSGEPTVFDELMRRTNRKINEKSTTADVMAAVEAAFSETLIHRMEQQTFLKHFGLTHAEFLEMGAHTFGETYFRQLAEEFRYVDLKTELLVFGFDSSGPRIFSASQYGVVLNEPLMFHAIGAGAQSALAWMHVHADLLPTLRIEEFAYRLCEAKFAAETARSVGDKNTALFVLYGNGSSSWGVLDGTAVRSAWNSKRRRRAPEKALAEITAALRQSG